VRPERFELPTFWFVARRSIQLSYERTVSFSRTSTRNEESAFYHANHAQPNFQSPPAREHVFSDRRRMRDDHPNIESRAAASAIVSSLQCTISDRTYCCCSAADIRARSRKSPRMPIDSAQIHLETFPRISECYSSRLSFEEPPVQSPPLLSSASMPAPP
jgi:hypothetical protein